MGGEGVGAIAGTGRQYEWLERAVAMADASGATFIGGVAAVTLASSRARDGDVAGAANDYRQLITRWLRTGAWAQQWTTLRNAAELLLGHDDRVAVRIWAGADADPQAAQLGPEAADRAGRQRRDAVARLGEARVRELEEQARATPRAQIAEDVAHALARLADRDPVPQDA